MVGNYIKPVEFITDYLILAKSRGYNLGDSLEVEFKSEVYEVMVVRKSDDYIILEIIDKQTEDSPSDIIPITCQPRESIPHIKAYNHIKNLFKGKD